MSQPFDSDMYVYDGELVRLKAGSDPAIKKAVGFHRFILAADPGSAQDPTGEVIIEDKQLPYWHSPHVQKLGERTRTCVFADRLREFRYSAVIEHLRGLMLRKPLAGRCRLVVDASGVGRGISDWLNDVQIPHTPVQMVSGASVTKAGRFWNCSKTVLLSALAAALEHGDLKIAADLPLRDELMLELESFTTRLSAAGNQVIDAQGGEGDHADMAIAAALGLFASDLNNGRFEEYRVRGYW